MGDIEVFLALLAGVAVVNGLARRLRLQAPSLLVGAGILAGLAAASGLGVPRITLDPHLVLVLFLPPLLYSAAINTSLRDFSANRRPIGLLSVGLVLATTAAVGFLTTRIVPGIPPAAAFALGAIVAPPDAVAAVAVGRAAGMPARLLHILEGESLVNDATALVTYRVAVGAAMGATAITAGGAVGKFALATVVGVGYGFLLSIAIAAVRRHLDDPPVENSLSLLTPFAAYLPAEAMGGSGVLAVVVAGIYLTRYSPVLLSSATRLEVHAMWRMIAYLLEGVVFALIGLQLPALLRAVSYEGTAKLLGLAGSVIALTVVVRFVWVFGGLYLPDALRGAAHPISGRAATVISWAGMRGVVSLAAALALPLNFPQRDLILFLTAAVIAATLLVQGATLPMLIRRLGLNDLRWEEKLEQEEAVANHHIARCALATLERIAAEEPIPAEIVKDQRHHLEERIRRAHATLGGCPGEDEYHRGAASRTDSRVVRDHNELAHGLRNRLIEAERAELLRLRNSGDIGDEVQRQVERMLDLEQVALPRR